jgi:hypothetical protein
VKFRIPAIGELPQAARQEYQLDGSLGRKVQLFLVVPLARVLAQPGFLLFIFIRRASGCSMVF